MAFSESLKSEVKKKAYFSCCLCKSVGIEVHHIVPSEEGGEDTFENAAPLCPTCHEIYGANPAKRKFIREARDFWYELCSQRFMGGSQQLREIRDLIKDVASKRDLTDLKGEILAAISSSTAQDGMKHYSMSISKSPFGWSMRELLTYLLSQQYSGKKDRFKVLFSSVLWDTKELATYRKEFLNFFGEEIARQLCLHVEEETGINLDDAFTAEQFGKVLRYLHMWVPLLLLVRSGKVQTGLNRNGKIVFWVNSSHEA